MIAQLPILSIVVPCYNEEEVLPETSTRLAVLITRLVEANKIDARSAIYFVDDGSKDRTWAILRRFSEQNARFRAIKLSRNRGHQNALMAGLLNVPGDLIVSIDADLQDDVDAIERMIDEAHKGSEIVFGVRSERSSDSYAKRLTAQAYYKLLALLSVEVVYDHADFRLMSRKAVEALRHYDESNLFLRALIPQLGYQTSVVHYSRAERFAGTSKYPFRKMLTLAFEGISSFSTKPLRLVTILGFCISVLSLGLTLWALLAAFVVGTAVPGWASTVIPIYLICGVQLLCIGIIGEYVGKIYLETKRRPRSHISEFIGPPLQTEPSRLCDVADDALRPEVCTIAERGEAKRFV